MLRNYLKVAFRVFWRSKGFGLINVTGLTIGISTCLLITLYILDELSFDRYHERADRIYRLTEILHLPGEDRLQALTSPPMAPALKENFPEVLATTRIDQSYRSMAYGEKKFYDTRISYSDSALFEIFSFDMIAGDPATALVKPYSLVITEDASRKFFGYEEALGKTLIFSDSIPVEITGVIKNIPSNSHIQFDVMLSRSSWTHMLHGEPENNWFDNSYHTYVLLAPGADPQALEKKYSDFVRKTMEVSIRETGLSYDFILKPLPEIHLRSGGILYSGAGNSDIRYIFIFSIIAGLVLLIACANYVNLSTARSLKRAREIGMRKVTGAVRRQLIFQLMSESFLITMFSTLVGVIVVALALPYFNVVSGKALTVAYLLDRSVLIVFGILFVSVVFLAGSYPALLMSSFSPIQALKGGIHTGRRNSVLREGLVVFQFSISMIMIALTVFIYLQMRFMQEKNIGLNKDQVVLLKMRRSVTQKEQMIKTEMLRVPGVVSASSTAFSFRERVSSITMRPEGSEPGKMNSINLTSIDEDFLSTFGIELIAGRNVDRKIKYTDRADSSAILLVNETAVRDFGWGKPEDAIEKKIRFGRNGKAGVYGVVKDFNYHSLHERIQPLVLIIEPGWYNYVAVKIEVTNMTATLAALEKSWNALQIDSPFDYSFMDQDFENLYRSEHQMQVILTFLASLSVFIACLGLFGLAAFMAEQRTKEIGIRKVLGASVMNVIALLSTSFLRLLIISIVIALPLAWYGMNRWIEDYAFRIEVSVWILVSAAGACILIALLAVSFQSLKAALANPVRALRTE